MKRLAILGSTGSIGTQVLDVVARFPERFEVVALAAGGNVELLAQQTKQFRPRVVSMATAEAADRLCDALGDPNVECGTDACEIAGAGADLVVAAQVGRVGLEPVLAALRAGSDVALANKEVLVVGGALVLREARRTGAKLLPLDSEHVAIAQCLGQTPPEALRRVVLTASGGPLREWAPDALGRATQADVLAHPNWSMGRKITVDSATLMNKGFEQIEARWLFELEPEQIDVVVHPESIVHSLVELVDGNWLAQLAVPDMRIPIAYTLGAPDERLPLTDLPRLDLPQIGALRFEPPDPERFPALELAREALHRGGLAPAALNAGNELAVQAFLEDRIPFTAIARVADETLRACASVAEPDLSALRQADREARRTAQDFIKRHYG